MQKMITAERNSKEGELRASWYIKRTSCVVGLMSLIISSANIDQTKPDVQHSAQGAVPCASEITKQNTP